MPNFETQSNKSKLYEIATIIDNEFFLESIKEQITLGLDCSSTDYLSMFNMKLKEVTDEFQEEDYQEVVQFKDELNKIIIELIIDKYNIQIFFEESNDIGVIAKQLYTVFVIEIRDIMIAFITAYIIENYKILIDTIGTENLKINFLPEVVEESEKYKLIAAGNLGIIIDKITDSYINFNDFIKYAARSGSIQSITDIDNGTHVLSIDDSNEILNTLMKSMHDSEFDHAIVMNAYEIIISNFDINKKDVSVYGENFNNKYEGEE